jgi:toxin ParE1/3/4
VSRFILTPAADADLEAVWDYVSGQGGDVAADRLEQRLHEAMVRIGEMPGIGHARDDVADETLRFLAVHSFLIVYRPQTAPVQIVRVIHGARDVGTVLGPHG